jgi:hypothetical protein
MERFLRRNFFTEEQNAKVGKWMRTTNVKEWRGLTPGVEGKGIRSTSMQTGFFINKTEVHIVEIEFYNLPRRRKSVAYVFTKKEYEQYIEEV